MPPAENESDRPSSTQRSQQAPAGAPGDAGAVMTPGERSRHLLARRRVRLKDNPEQDLLLLVSRLEFSGHVWVNPLPDDDLETVLRGLFSHFVAMGGIPSFATFSHPPGSMLDADNPEAWNPAVRALERDAGVVLERAGESEDDRLLDGFLAGARFRDVPDAIGQLAAWVLERNTGKAMGFVPAVRWTEERACLRPLPCPAESFAVGVPVVVGSGGRVPFEGNIYYVSKDLSGRSATLLVRMADVAVVCGEETLVHPRLFGRGEASNIPGVAVEPALPETWEEMPAEIGEPGLLETAALAVYWVFESILWLAIWGVKQLPPEMLARGFDRAQTVLQDVRGAVRERIGAAAPALRAAGERCGFALVALVDGAGRTLKSFRIGCVRASIHAAILAPIVTHRLRGTARSAAGNIPRALDWARSVGKALIRSLSRVSLRPALALLRGAGRSALAAGRATIDWSRDLGRDAAEIASKSAKAVEHSVERVEAATDQAVDVGHDRIVTTLIAAWTIAGRGVRALLAAILRLLERIPD